jgi:crotonobetainyl-CoA:carnitine CoA-transferase CaiB-like acyl-CoA transferase
VSSTAGPLEGLLVADFSRALAGPYATMLLGDLGATVVKVERPGGGDESRGWGPPFSNGVSTYYQAINRNKRVAVCDLATEDGRAAARELCMRADVVVENFRAGALERMGLGAPDLLRRKPSLVYCSITAFGRDGGRDMPGYDFLLQAMGGLMSITGEADGGPVRVGVAVVDVLTGLHALVGILAALRHRDATGRGQHVEVDLLTSILSGLVDKTSGYLNAGVVPRRMGNRHPSLAPYELVPAKDRALALAIGNDAQFAAFCAEAGIAGVAADERFRTNAARVENRDEMLSRISAALAADTADGWVARLTARGVPCGVVNQVDEAIELAARLGLEPAVEMTDSGGRTWRQARSPITFSDSQIDYRLAPTPIEDAVTLDVLLRELA